MLLIGDCVEQMRTLDADSVDAIVTDPPYGLEFMGKGWDGFGTPLGFQTWTEQWAREALRVLKPGGHLLAFGGTRMYHRLAAGIEDAGFEIRDTLMWLYGSGFPKSLDVSKAIDKMDAKDEQQARRHRFTEWVRSTGATAQQIDQATGSAMGGHYTTHPSQPAIMTRQHLEACRHLLGEIPEWVERECDIRSLESRNFAEREVIGLGTSAIANKSEEKRHTIGASKAVEFNITAPSTEAAKKWQGWGTALKPAVEPIVLARKPLIGTVAENVLKHGTGALNIEASRIGTTVETWPTTRSYAPGQMQPLGIGLTQSTGATPPGRWPANILLDEAAAAMLDEQSGVLTSGAKNGGIYNSDEQSPSNFSTGMNGKPRTFVADASSGGASRFFYVAKASRAERNKGLEHMEKKETGALTGSNNGGLNRSGKPPVRANIHPTVKPVDLMRYLIRLVTPKGGTVLDPFMGSGTTAVAAIEEGANWIGCEREPEYVAIIKARISAAQPGMGLNLEEDTK